MEKYAVIVAGGSGTRMKAKLPKQFIEIGSLPILMHTVLCFQNFRDPINIILVLPKNQIDTWESLCIKYQFLAENITIIEGGKSRFQSCKNGIMAVENHENALVAIHDGVRPFVSNQIIEKGFEIAQKLGTAICAVESKDSARIIAEDGLKNEAINRQSLRLVQTPQVFQLKILKKAYGVDENENFTDDASVVEAAGYAINLFEGSYKNIKITTAEDLTFAQIFINE